MALSIDDLNGFEMIELKQRVGGRIEAADGVDMAYALYFVFKKREVEGFSYDDALGTRFGDVQEYLGLEDEAEFDGGDPFAVDDDSDDPKD